MLWGRRGQGGGARGPLAYCLYWRIVGLLVLTASGGETCLRFRWGPYHMVLVLSRLSLRFLLLFLWPAIFLSLLSGCRLQHVGWFLRSRFSCRF